MLCSNRVHFFQVQRMALCNFNGKKDIVRSLLCMMAPDKVWVNISWQGSNTKKSFCADLSCIQTLILEVSRRNFQDIDGEFCNTRVKTFLRHAKERLTRKDENISTLSPLIVYPSNMDVFTETCEYY